MKIDRFLAAILAGIGLLAVLALVLFFTRQNQLGYGSEDTPEGVVHNYTVALHNKDFDRAYGYLAEDTYKPSREIFQQVLLANQSGLNGASLQVEQTTLQGDQAFLSINVMHVSSNLFGDVYREPQSGLLVHQSGAWKLKSLPYPYFNWDWYQQQPVKS
jgi:hypothetical protein